MRKLRVGLLFWKLLLALWLCILLSIAGTIALFRLAGASPPPLPDKLMVFGLLPAEPLVSAALAVLIIGIALAWYLSRPLRHLRWGLRRMAQGRFDTRVLPLMKGRRDEIADLAVEFDRMAAQLQQLTASHQVLLHDVSHELRSPLTRLQAAIGLMRQDPAKMDAMLERIQREGQRLDALVEELLTLHRLEAGAHPVRERVDLIELLHAIADDAAFEAEAGGRSVSIEAHGQFVTEVNGELIYRAFENVIRNAVKFAPAGSTVEIHAGLDPENSSFLTSVLDRGPGVPEDQLQTMFEPFVRLEGAEASRGTGLGLAISKRAVELHGGRIWANRRAGGGLEVSLRLPAEMGAS